MTDKIQKIREVIEKRYEYWRKKEFNSHSIESEIRMSECKRLLFMVDSLQEEPVSEELKTELNEYIKNHFTIDTEQLDKFGIEEKDYMYSMDKSDILALVKHFTKWQKTKAEPTSEELEEAADNALNNVLNTHEIVNIRSCLEMFKFGAKWKEKEMQFTIELAEDNAMLAGMEKMKEEMMTKSIEAVVSQVPCSNEIILYNPSSVDRYYLPQEMNKLGLNKGDKVKVIIIKED